VANRFAFDVLFLGRPGAEARVSKTETASRNSRAYLGVSAPNRYGRFAILYTYRDTGIGNGATAHHSASAVA
jgi:hypothetical protein